MPRQFSGDVVRDPKSNQCDNGNRVLLGDMMLSFMHNCENDLIAVAFLGEFHGSSIPVSIDREVIRVNDDPTHLVRLTVGNEVVNVCSDDLDWESCPDGNGYDDFP